MNNFLGKDSVRCAIVVLTPLLVLVLLYEVMFNGIGGQSEYENVECTVENKMIVHGGVSDKHYVSVDVEHDSKSIEVDYEMYEVLSVGSEQQCITHKYGNKTIDVKLVLNN